MKHTLLLLFTLSAFLVVPVKAQQPTQPAASDASTLTIDRIFNSDELQSVKLGVFIWSKRTPSYFTLDAPQAADKARNLVHNDLASGTKEVVVPVSAFIPPGTDKPLEVDAFEFSADETKLLIFTNSKRVWRSNTRGDYWVLDMTTRELKKLGGDAEPSTLMFAKFSPDGTRVAYVRANNLFIQDLRDMRITALTTDGSTTLINGTSDWVNEEELGIRDGYRWSPDGKAIAFWQFDTGSVREFHLLGDSEGNYPRVISFPYPQVGEKNSATRLGVVSATGASRSSFRRPWDTGTR